MALYTLPKQYDSEFSQPNKKPVKGVELDLNNDFAKRLLFSVVATQQFGTKDLVSGEIPANTNVGISPKDGDIAAVYNDSNSKSVFNNPKVLISNVKPWTICWRGRLDLFGSQEHDIASLKSTASNSFVLFHLNLAAYRDVAWGSNSADFVQGKIDIDFTLLEEDTVIFVAFDGVDATNLSSYKAWVDRSEESVVSGGNFGGTVNTTILGSRQTTGSEAYGGYQKYFHVFDFNFTQGDVNRFFDSQYQTLKPTSPPGYFTEATTGISITVTDITSSQTISNVNLVQSHVFSVDNITSNQTVSSSSLLSGVQLLVDNVLSDQSLSVSSFNQANVLSVDSVTTGQSLSNASLVIAGVLNVDDLLSEQQISTVDFVQKNLLAVDDIDTTQTISQSVIDTGINLIVDDISTAQSISSSGLTQHNILLVDPITNTQFIGVVNIGGDGQVIGKVTAAFKENDISVKYGILNITVKFKE